MQVIARTERDIRNVTTILKTQGARALAVTADVADPSAVIDAMAEIAKSLGPIDVLVNNAGVIEPLGATVLIDSTAWRHSRDQSHCGILVHQGGVTSYADPRMGANCEYQHGSRDWHGYAVRQQLFGEQGRP